MIVLWINNLLITDATRTLMDFSFAYTFNTQEDGVAMFFVVVKMLQPDTCTGFSDIKSNL